MVYDKNRKVHSCDICLKEYRSWWRMSLHYFYHGLKKDELPSIEEAKLNYEKSQNKYLR